MVRSESTNLDALRAVAVLAVLTDHLLDCALPVSFQVRTAAHGLGAAGVLLFFIHTSLVLMQSLGRLDADRQGAIAARFYIRRVCRLYPLSVFVVITVVGLGLPTYFRKVHEPPSSAALLSNLLLIQNITGAESIPAQLWTLPFEMQMYLALPFLYGLGKRLRSRSGMLLLGFCLWYAERRFARWLGYPPLLEYAPFFMAGISVYFIQRPSQSLPTWMYGGCLTIILTIHFWMYGAAIGHRSGWIKWALFTGFAILLPYFKEISVRWLCTSVRLIAKYSYGIYLSHVTIMWFAFERLSALTAVERVVVFVVLMVVIPIALFHLIEQPAIRFGVRLANQVTSRYRPVTPN